jgi:hypothetical protein
MSNQVRVFLSSTFIDFARERELIHENVAPTLDEMSRHFGLAFELSDLRWGVTAKDVQENRTVAICLNEVDYCRQVSPELNFLDLLGDRAGSRFIPNEVPGQVLLTFLDELATTNTPDLAILAAQLRSLFPAENSTRNGMLVRDNSPTGQQLAKNILNELNLLNSFAEFTCSDVAAEELRRSLRRVLLFLAMYCQLES